MMTADSRPDLSGLRSEGFLPRGVEQIGQVRRVREAVAAEGQQLAGERFVVARNICFIHAAALCRLLNEQLVVAGDA